MSNQNKQIEYDQIDLINLVKTVWQEKKIVIKITLIFIIIGLFVAIFSEKEYTTSTTFVSQTSDSKVGGSLGGLAAMAGINFGAMNTDSGISPSLYPQILNSISFQKELLQTLLTFKGEKEKVSLKKYYNEIYTPGLFSYLKKYTFGLPMLIIDAIRGESNLMPKVEKLDINLVSISKEEFNLIKQLGDQISLEVNEVDGYVTISSCMPEALAAAQLTLKIRVLLQKYVINLKIQKSKEKLDYIKERYSNSKNNYIQIQKKLASYKDSNKFVSTAQGSTALVVLQDEYDLIYGVYSELSKQLEAQYLQVAEDTPLFTVLKPVTIPIEKSKPERFLILLGWLFFGLFSGLILVFSKKSFKSLKETWDK